MKKIISILGIVACAAVLFFNVSLSGNKSSNSMNLSSMTKISKANAECAPDEGWMTGECITQICFYPNLGGATCAF